MVGKILLYPLGIVPVTVGRRGLHDAVVGGKGWQVRGCCECCANIREPANLLPCRNTKDAPRSEHPVTFLDRGRRVGEHHGAKVDQNVCVVSTGKFRILIVYESAEGTDQTESLGLHYLAISLHDSCPFPSGTGTPLLDKVNHGVGQVGTGEF